MKIKWKKLLINTLCCVTMPLWIFPAIIFTRIFEVVEAFIDEYVE